MRTRSIKAARLSKGLTQAQVAVRVGVDPRAVSGWENGEYSPTEKHQVKLERILSIKK